MLWIFTRRDANRPVLLVGHSWFSGGACDGARLRGLLARTASGELPARVPAVVPLDQVADPHRAMANSGVRGRYVLKP